MLWLLCTSAAGRRTLSEKAVPDCADVTLVAATQQTKARTQQIVDEPVSCCRVATLPQQVCYMMMAHLTLLPCGT